MEHATFGALLQTAVYVVHQNKDEGGGRNEHEQVELDVLQEVHVLALHRQKLLVGEGPVVNASKPDAIELVLEP